MMFLFVHPLTPMLRGGDQKIILDDPWTDDRPKTRVHLRVVGGRDAKPAEKRNAAGR